MKKLLLALALLPVCLFSYSQFQGVGANRGGKFSGQNINIGHFYGKLVDAKTNKPIAAATIQLKGNKYDTATKKMKEIILATVLTQANGDFSLDELPVFGNFKFTASAIGYKPLDKPLSFGIKFPQGGVTGGLQEGNGGAVQQIIGMADKDLGNLKMQVNPNDLGNVTVTAPVKQQFEMGIDRKVFNVDKNLVSTGQTATEIMKSIPSLNVDIDGNVTLRNATPTIFIDDRPTTLTLDQIPSDIIDKVEIITNPSAKYDASGGNAGIINIVLKKNKKTGYNGGLRTGIDSWGKVNAGGDLSVRQGKINAFINTSYNQRKFVSNSNTIQNNLFNPPSNIHANSDAINNGNFRFIRGGLDFLADNRNTITLSGNYVRGQFSSETNFTTDSTINSVYSAYNQSKSTSNRSFENTGGQLGYKHNFAKNGHDITADFNYNSSQMNSNGYNNTFTYYPNTTTQKQIPLLQQSVNEGFNHFYTAQTDYENPFADNKKIEAGARAAIRDFGNNSTQLKFNPATGNYETIRSISNKYKFNDQVYAAYFNYSAKIKNWSYQLGIRAESSNYTGTLLNAAGADSANFKVKYPLSLFPSAFITYKVDDKQDVQVNYSRRINRPNFFQLIPFPDYSNYPITVSVGNPELKPEFTNSFELSYDNAYKKSSNFLATLFFKYTTDLLTRYTYRGKDALKQNSNDSVYYSTFINANSGISYGLELTNKMPVTKWWDIILNVNLFNSQINASNVNGVNGTAGNISVPSNSLVSWFGKMNNTFKLSKGFSIQFSGDYQSKTVLPQNSGGGGGRGPFSDIQTTAQGYVLPRYGFDAAIRKDWTWKKGQSGSLTLGINDIFHTEYYKTYSEQSGLFMQNNERISNPQVLRLNFSYRFGKFDANLFKRKNLKSDQGSGMDMIGNN